MRGTRFIFVASAIAALVVTIMGWIQGSAQGLTDEVLAGFMTGVMSATCWAFMRREMIDIDSSSSASFIARNVPPFAAALVITWLGLRSLDRAMWTLPVLTWVIGVVLVLVLLKPMKAMRSNATAH